MFKTNLYLLFAFVVQGQGINRTRDQGILKFREHP